MWLWDRTCHAALSNDVSIAHSAATPAPGGKRRGWEVGRVGPEMRAPGRKGKGGGVGGGEAGGWFGCWRLDQRWLAREKRARWSRGPRWGVWTQEEEKERANPWAATSREHRTGRRSASGLGTSTGGHWRDAKGGAGIFSLVLGLRTRREETASRHVI